MDVAAVCFDLDGTLIRSEEIRDGVRRAYVAEAGGTWTREADREMSGMHLMGWATYLHDRLGVARAPAKIAAELEARIAAIYRERLPLVPGARETLARCAALWPLALATGSPHRLIDLVLDGGDLRTYFRAAVSVDDVGEGKPAPAVYLRAAALLGIAPERCVAVEDSANGIRAAFAAGMGVVAVGAGPPAERTLAGGYVLRTVADLASLSPAVIRRAARSPA